MRVYRIQKGLAYSPEEPNNRVFKPPVLLVNRLQYGRK
ncbi:MAG: hypothetical protein JWO30_838 [Fibrobacteres bacterium]|nr:hypothetical protein [Fibrobacterota bacterium]